MLTIVSLCPVLTQFRFGKHPAGTPAVCLTDTEKKLHRETEPMVKFTWRGALSGTKPWAIDGRRPATWHRSHGLLHNILQMVYTKSSTAGTLLINNNNSRLWHLGDASQEVSVTWVFRSLEFSRVGRKVRKDVSETAQFNWKVFLWTGSAQGLTWVHVNTQQPHSPQRLQVDVQYFSLPPVETWQVVALVQIQVLP